MEGGGGGSARSRELGLMLCAETELGLMLCTETERTNHLQHHVTKASSQSIIELV